MVGMQQQMDDLDLAMNRAAETAVVDAKPLVVDAVKKMTVQDAKNILTGGDTAATDYFRSKTADPRAKKFLPTMQKATAKVGLAQCVLNHFNQARFLVRHQRPVGHQPHFDFLRRVLVPMIGH